MTEQVRGPVTELSLTGELDMATAPELQARIDDLITRDRCRIVLDLAGLMFCDSAGLNTFVLADRRCQSLGGWLRVRGARGNVVRVMQLSGLADVLTYRPQG